MDIFSTSTWLSVILAALVLTLPGTALYMLAARTMKGRAEVGVWPALLPGIGLSVAFWPLLLLYVSLLGLRLDAFAVWLVLGLALVSIVWLSWTDKSPKRPTMEELLTGVTLAGMTLTALVFRLGDVQGLAVPMFGDSLHHTMITSIIEIAGRVPGGYQPYLPVDTFTYHFGFHTLAAITAMLTGVAPSGAVLIMGQVLNVASLPVAYLLSRTLFDSRLAGLLSALITGFVSVMPAYYVNWGRYTQLAGLVLLPVAMVMLVRIVRRDAKGYEVALAAFCIAGLVVVHYRILIFYALFIAALAGWYLVSNLRERDVLIKGLVRVGLAVGAALIATAPWLWNLYTNYFWGLVDRLSSVSPEYIASYNAFENFQFYAGRVLPLLGLSGVLVALVHIFLRMRRPVGTANVGGEKDGLAPALAALTVASWAVLIVGSIWIVPGAIGSFAAAITLYLPLSALGGYAIAWLIEKVALRLKVSLPRLSLALLLVAPLAALVMGTWHVSDPARFSYVRDEDIKAFEWIKEKTPQESKFLISSEISYAGRGVTASDAGMWLPLLAERPVSLPALSSWSEHPVDPELFTNARQLGAYTQPGSDPEIRRLVALGTVPAPLPPDDPELLALMQRLGITHVYSGTAGGASKQRLDVAAMRRDSCHYNLLYSASGVYVFQVIYSCK
ncbi:MAG TPA: hypothetical protein VJ183_02800 [Chloroflexia bacterium]|nr:hypothetical protein [Chloroflexia bacterium]